MKMEAKYGILFVIFGFLVFCAFAEVAAAMPEEAWNKTFGGANDDFGRSVRQTSDGGYIIIGVTSSYGAGNSHAYADDIWLIKTDSKGDEEWNKTFGSANVYDNGYSVQQTLDGGYILAGTTTPPYGVGSTDVWLIKADSKGDEEWNKTFGGAKLDYGYSVQQTLDGGYVLTGNTMSYGAGSRDAWLIKTDSKGNEEWNKTFGGAGDDDGESIQQTSDGGYIITGDTWSYGAGIWDVWLIKTDSKGDEEWNKTFGGAEWDGGHSVQQTSDGGYIITGDTGSYGAGFKDAWLIKTNSKGDEEWNRTFGSEKIDYGLSGQQTSDGGYILITEETGAGSGRWGDVWLIKTDSKGDEEWNKTFGGAEEELCFSVQQTSDSGYIITGGTSSYGAGEFDVWLIKVKGEEPTISIFDTRPSENPYTSIMGTHKGEIKPSYNINVSKLYTYPCVGTGGHTESIELYENTTVIASGTWNGYQEDWHNLTITPSVILQAGHTYNYTIITGSYPQIIHAKSKDVTGGTITCTSFVDANGKRYNELIPAIKLYYDEGEMPSPITARAINNSTKTQCAEEDNINIPFFGNIPSFVVEASHPTYEVDTYKCKPNFTNCPPPTGPNYSFTPKVSELFNDGETIVEAVRCETWWRPNGMTASVVNKSMIDAHYIRIYRKVADANEWPQFFVLYMDGNLRLIPQPPEEAHSVCFGSSVIIGATVNTSPSSRPIAEITSVVYFPESEVVKVVYKEGGSAIISLKEMNRKKACVQINVNYSIDKLPFACFRSMFVTDGNADVDHVMWKDALGNYHDDAIMAFHGGNGTEWFFYRSTKSCHNPSAPDIHIKLK
jgi:hypothetical protein